MTFTSGAASAAAASDSATTSATGWPTNMTRSRASSSRLRLVGSIAGRSAAVSTRTTPACVSAALASIASMRALGCGLVTKRACNTPLCGRSAV